MKKANFCSMFMLFIAVLVGTLWSGGANPYFRGLAKKGSGR
jgi:hypothetical protein